MNLFRNYEKEFEDLQKSVSTIGDMVSFQETNVRSDIAKLHKNQNEFESELIALYEKQDEIFEQLKEIKALLLPPTNEVPVEDIKEPVVVSSDPILDEPQEYYFGGLRISKTGQKEFKFTELDKSNFKFKFYTNGRDYHSGFTVFDLLILKQLGDERACSSWTDFSAKMEIRSELIRQMAYNIITGFFNDKIDYDINFSEEYGFLCVNGKKTRVSIKTARYIIDCMINSNKPMTTLLKLEKAGEISKLMYRIIGANYLNGELCNLLHEDKKVPIENNPQKRREKSMLTN